MPEKEMSIYEELKLTGCYMSNHSSDLYVEVNEVNRAIIKKHKARGTIANPSVFVDQITGKQCYDIPFAYDPYWEMKMKSNPAYQKEPTKPDDDS